MKNKLSPAEQENRVHQIRRFLRETLHVTNNFHLSSWFIRRYLCARDFDLRKSTDMIEGYIKFRRRILAKIKRENRPAGK